MIAFPESMRTSEVAKLLGVAERTVRRWCKAGKIPARRVGEKLWLVKPRVLEERCPDLFAEMMERAEERAA
jgi:excisionase family DNA binding protein